jgi:hypothetical protein
MTKLTHFFFHTLPGGLIVTAVVIAAAITLYFHQPAEDDKYPGCMIYAVTGLHCPGCGGTRGTHELLHGHVGQALDYNLFTTTFAIFLGYFLLAKGARRLRIPFPLPKYNHKIMVGYLVLMGLFVVLRNIPVAPFNWLAPNRSPVYEHHNKWK